MIKKTAHIDFGDSFHNIHFNESFISIFELIKSLLILLLDTKTQHIMY